MAHESEGGRGGGREGAKEDMESGGTFHARDQIDNARISTEGSASLFLASM